MPWSISNLSSTGTMSNSDSKSYDSTFSRRHRHKASYSTHYTSPLHSAPPSPVLHPAAKVVNKVDPQYAALLGIESDALYNTVNVQTNSNPFNYPSSLEALLPSKNDNITPCQNQRMSMSNKPSITSHSLDLDILDKSFAGSSSADASSPHGSFDSTDKDSEDEDIDLEKAADDALSQWFGISLRRLVRPIRVIYAFEQVKWQCASILRDEGHCVQDDEVNEDIGVRTIPGDPHDAGESSRSNCAIRPLTGTSTVSPSGGSIPTDGRTSQSGSSPQNSLSVKGKNKGYRIWGELSCPYRKRNPIKFNIRDYEKCANKPFPNIPFETINTISNLTSSRKHLTSAHFKDRCTRCQKEFSLSSELMMHYRRCPHAPGSPSRMGTQNSDPENGFGETVDSQLRSRGANQNIKEWAHLWNALFPEDENIPDHSFDPVVEDYEVYDQYEHTKWNIAQDISVLLAQEIPYPIVDLEKLSGMIMNSVQGRIEAILARPKAFRQPRQSSPGYTDPEIQMAESPESGFVDIPAENVTGNSSSESDCLLSMLGTPGYSSPDGGMGEANGEQQYEYDSQNIDFSSEPLNTQPMAYMPDYMPNSGTESQNFASFDFGAPVAYDNASISAYGSNLLLQEDQNYDQNALALTGAVPLSNTHPSSFSNGFNLTDWGFNGNCQSHTDDIG
ncbi:hypothetical protein F4815DRAFT_503858 [Daldinia loculata]|nr:hypothetical protein F4815DRAFT_503858 [Daldinia loculata]